MSDSHADGKAVRNAARRRSLLDAATRLFARHGYHATTVPMIVAEAGVSIGAFYLSFRHKEDVLEAALEELDVELARILAEVHGPDADIPYKMARSVETLFLFLACHPERARMLIVESSGLGPRIEGTRRQLLSHHETFVQHTLESSPGVSELKDASVAARCVVGSVFEVLYSWLDESPTTRVPAADVARAVAAFNYQALRKGVHEAPDIPVRLPVTQIEI